MSIIAFAQLSQPVDIKLLQKDVNLLLSSEWVGHVNKNDYQGEWDVLPLRCPKAYAKQHAILQSFSLQEQSEWQNLPALITSPNLTPCAT
ncbi:MAG: hypothetical protein ACJAXJ_003307 [Colwellia sp.]|jgi:hypothetical protein